MHQNPPRLPTPSQHIAYQPFSNEEVSPGSADWQGSPNVIQQGIPVGSAVSPVMSYPVPMSHFEVASPVIVSAINDPAYAKLDTWPYMIYKYWVLVSISMNLFGTVMICVRLGFSQQFAWDLLNFILHVWSVAQLIFVFEGISKRSEQKIDKALKFMKIFAFLLWVFIFVRTTRKISGVAFQRLLHGDDHQDGQDRTDDRDDRDNDDDRDEHRHEHGRGHHNFGHHGGFENNEGRYGIFACETDICRVQFLISALLLAFVAVGLFYIFYWYGARKVKQVLQAARTPQNQRAQQQIQRA